MELKFIEKLIALVDKHQIDLFEYNRSGDKLRIVRRHAPARSRVVAAAAAPQTALLPAAPLPPAAEQAPITPSVETPGDGNTVEMKSPMVGTFYRAPSPDADPYVKIGDHVEVGQVLCIVEAMKLMNEIQSEYAGKIIEISAKNAQPVQFGQPMFIIDKD
ncbi:MAG: acetyl-CoA carboxylase, biotin carboxyl carrier protein [Candidatus Cloacimonetes bacterium 4572_55]|nr:MAG: acetyl-CoA carboxylase, biotin carboxyl carrier protein [Candidatus Cloacimonetes bacterium 4572_55]